MYMNATRRNETGDKLVHSFSNDPSLLDCKSITGFIKRSWFMAFGIIVGKLFNTSFLKLTFFNCYH